MRIIDNNILGDKYFDEIKIFGIREKYTNISFNNVSSVDVNLVYDENDDVSVFE
jgi:hypothetical protein